MENREDEKQLLPFDIKTNDIQIAGNREATEAQIMLVKMVNTAPRSFKPKDLFQDQVA